VSTQMKLLLATLVFLNLSIMGVLYTVFRGATIGNGVPVLLVVGVVVAYYLGEVLWRYWIGNEDQIDDL